MHHISHLIMSNHSIKDDLTLLDIALIIHNVAEKLSYSWNNQYLPFPCDIQLLTVRPIANRERLMVLHRNGIDCDGDQSTLCPVVGLDVSRLCIYRCYF